MRYLLDTNVIVAAFRSRTGASQAILRRALSNDLPLVVHPKLLYEYRDVLSRPDTLDGSGITFSEAELVLAHLAARAANVEVRYLWRPNLRDEGDNFVLEIAVAAWPCTIVTHNVADFQRTELRFPQVVVMTPGQLIKSLTH
jgi:putative PIN family toxin of toxin-antitoxin system